MNTKTNTTENIQSINTSLDVNLDIETISNLDKMVSYYNKSRVDIIKLSINRLYSDIKDEI